MFTALVSLVAALSCAFVSAAPGSAVYGRNVPTETCADFVTGYLTGGQGGAVEDKFSIGADNKTVVYGSRGNGIPVSFQICSPNFGQYSNEYTGADTVYAGHMNIPDINTCLYVDSRHQSNEYNLTVEPCTITSDSRQIFYNFVRYSPPHAPAAMHYWAGYTNAAGTQIQNKDFGCSRGWFGYIPGSDKEGEPVTLACADLPGVLPFRVALPPPKSVLSFSSPVLAFQSGWDWLSGLFGSVYDE